MEQVIGTETMTRCTPQRKLLELLFKFDIRDHYRAKKRRFLDVVAEVCMGKRRLLRRNVGLTRILRLKHMKLKPIQDLRPVKPGQRQRRGFTLLRLIQQPVRLGTLGQLEIHANDNRTQISK